METNSRTGRLRRALVPGLGVALILCLYLFRHPLRQYVMVRAVLANDAPSEALEHEMIQNARDPQAALLAAWATGKIIHRKLAVRELSHMFPNREPLPPKLRAMLLAAALDADLDVREIALSLLNERHDPDFAALCAAQLSDVDPQVRLLGLMRLEGIPGNIGVPIVVPLLSDNDPQVTAYAIRLLEHWSGEDFGVKLRDALPVEDGKTGLIVFDDATYARTRAGANRARQWWNLHREGFKGMKLEIPAEARAAMTPGEAGDFALRDLDGKLVHLSEFRGKTVLINFWATWCTACLGELPELTALQKAEGQNLVILGVSLDFVPDDDSGGASSTVGQIRQKVARVAAARGIHYPVLLDEKGEVGSRFDGGELPTTVIVDGEGRIRRRFIGTRPLPVFRAMIAEASKPFLAGH